LLEQFAHPAKIVHIKGFRLLSVMWNMRIDAEDFRVIRYADKNRTARSIRKRNNCLHNIGGFFLVI